MTKIEAIAKIQSTLSSLTTEQAEALAELVSAWTRQTPTEDDAALTAIRDGIAQAEAGEFAEASEVDALLGRPWK